MIEYADFRHHMIHDDTDIVISTNRGEPLYSM